MCSIKGVFLGSKKEVRNKQFTKKIYKDINYQNHKMEYIELMREKEAMGAAKNACLKKYKERYFAIVSIGMGSNIIATHDALSQIYTRHKYCTVVHYYRKDTCYERYISMWSVRGPYEEKEILNDFLTRMKVEYRGKTGMRVSSTELDKYDYYLVEGSGAIFFESLLSFRESL